MRNLSQGFILVCLVTTVASESSAQVAPENMSATHGPGLSVTRDFIDSYCIACHNERLKTAGLVLDKLDLKHVTGEAELWEKVLRKLRTRMMPPAGRPRPDADTLANVVTSLESVIDREAISLPEPGRPAVHRLNRFEYSNAIRDLLALEVDGRSLLPADDAGYGFDNIADVLSVSPGLMERYLAAAEKIARLAIGDLAIGTTAQTYKLPYLSLLQEDRMSNDLPAGSQGGTAIRHYFPLDGTYLIKIRLQTEPQYSKVRGLDHPQQIDLRIDGERVKLFAMEAQAAENFMSQTERIRADEGLEVRIPIKAGPRVVAVTFLRQKWYMESVGPERLPATSFGFASGTRSDERHGKQLMGVDTLTIEGPFSPQAPKDTPSRQRVFVCHPNTQEQESGCAEQILVALAKRAYRRPLHNGDVTRLMRSFNAGRVNGDFETGIQQALETILVSPEFLFRIERDPSGALPGAVHNLTDLELASRLSFFLWSSIPDDQLLTIAAEGNLRNAKTLEQQVQRMLQDPKSQAFIQNFFDQWLWLRNLATARPDQKTFPEFDESLRRAFATETQLFLENQFHNDRSLLELLTADYTFVNEKLARHYGMPHVYGSHFRQVHYSGDQRKGLLGHGSILTVTSYPNRTSPVVRGKWLLETLLGAPPPAPPPNVPPFPENEGPTQQLSVRERMEQHRKNPACAGCHAQLDPLGFALENFNGIGEWRATDANMPVDASGVLPGGEKFDDPAQFRSMLLSYRSAFVSNAVQKLLTYALGRGVEYYDMPAVRQIVRETEKQNHSWSSIILAIVRSVPFQMRKVPVL